MSTAYCDWTPSCERARATDGNAPWVFLHRIPTNVNLYKKKKGRARPEGRDHYSVTRAPLTSRSFGWRNVLIAALM